MSFDGQVSFIEGAKKSSIFCCTSQEKRYEEACARFNTVLQVIGFKADICYCIALCHYKMNQYAAALKYITEIIERGIKEHPGKKATLSSYLCD